MKQKRNGVKKAYRYIRRSAHKAYRQFVGRVETELGYSLDEACSSWDAIAINLVK